MCGIAFCSTGQSFLLQSTEVGAVHPYRSSHCARFCTFFFWSTPILTVFFFLVFFLKTLLSNVCCGCYCCLSSSSIIAAPQAILWNKKKKRLNSRRAKSTRHTRNKFTSNSHQWVWRRHTGFLLLLLSLCIFQLS